MTASGLAESDLAVITPYRQQIKLLSGLFTSMPKVEILTADKSQGRDKECILISLVRANDFGQVCHSGLPVIAADECRSEIC